MEKNQQQKSIDSNSEKLNVKGTPNNESMETGKKADANAGRFADTKNTNEQHSESSKPDAANETLGTP